MKQRKRMNIKVFPERMPKDPVELFLNWYQEAIDGSIPEYDAMTLATFYKGKPSARMVLLKSAGKDGFVFFSNYNSRKGSELAANPQAALVFYWKELMKQVRIEGLVEKTSESESDEYFSSRPRGSQIGAWASPQSKLIQNKDYLLENAKQYNAQFSGKKVPRPPYWGGYRLTPERIEFWISGEDRLHDRMVYVRNKSGWTIQRLAP